MSGGSRAKSSPGLPATVYYDAACPLCRSLAAWGMGAQAESPSPSLRFEPASAEVAAVGEVVVDEAGQRYTGAAAWERIIAKEPRLGPLRWVAERLGLIRPLAGIARRTGHTLRSWCRSCPGPGS